MFSASNARGSLLKVTGFIFDTVVRKSRVMDARDFAIPPSLAAEGPFIDKLWRDVSSASYKLDIPIDHGLFGISMLSNWDERESAQQSQMVRAWFDTYCKLARAALPGYSGLSTEFHEGDVRTAYNVAQRLIQCNDARCVVLTHKGGIGIVPNATECGDACCIILGATVPFILAPVANGRYKLVGDSYIHGVMDGQLVDQYNAYEIILE